MIGYTVYYTLTVAIRDIDKNKQKIAKVIDDLLNNKVYFIYGIQYDTLDPSTGKQVARKNAWNDVLKKVKQYANLSGKKLGKALIIEEEIQLNSDATATTKKATSGTLQNNIPQIPIGTIVITVIINVTWQLI